MKRNKKTSVEELPVLRHSGIAVAAGLTGQFAGIEQSITVAQEHWNVGQNQQAEILCLQVLTQIPGYPPALHLLGLIAHTVGKLPEAIEFMRGACASSNAPALYHSNFAEICRQGGQLGNAERAARRALELDPDNLGALSNLGIILQEADKLDASLDVLRRVVELDPTNSEFHNNLGNTLQCAGLLLEAKTAYSTAIELNPDYDSAYANLARLLSELGEFDAGLEAARQAIDINPQCNPAYLHAATIHIKRQQLPEALCKVDALLNYMPTHAEALQVRAALLSDADEPEEAEHAARQALTLAPNSGDAALALAKVLQAQSRHDEALAMFAQAVKNNPANKDAAPVGQAALLIELGRMQEAQTILRQVLQDMPRSAAAWLHLSRIKKFVAQDADLALMEAALEQGQRDGLALHDRIGLYFALGKARMDSGDIERALDAYDEANRLQRSMIDYDVRANKAWMATIAQQVPSQLLRALAAAGAGDPSEKPIFIIGMPRSGTTLIEQILASHPQVFGADELRTVQSMINSIVGPDEQPLPYPAMMSTLGAEDFTELGAYYVDTVTLLAPGKSRIVDKMPLNFLYAGFIHLMLPNARIIHTRRNPVDTCMSCYCQPFSSDQKFTFDLAELGDFYDGYQSLMQHWRDLLPPSRFLEIDYEDVVDDLEGSARKLIEFCGLAWDDACLSFHTTTRRVRTASMAQVRQPIYRDSIGRWKPHAARLAPLLNALNGALDDTLNGTLNPPSEGHDD